MYNLEMMVDIMMLLIYCEISLHICFCSRMPAGGIMDMYLVNGFLPMRRTGMTGMFCILADT